MVVLEQITEEELREGIENMFSNLKTFSEFSHELDTPVSSLNIYFRNLDHKFGETYQEVILSTTEVLDSFKEIKDYINDKETGSGNYEFEVPANMKRRLSNSFNCFVNSISTLTDIEVRENLEQGIEDVFREYNGVVRLLKSVDPLEFPQGKEVPIYELWYSVAFQAKRMGLVEDSSIFFTYSGKEYDGVFMTMGNEGDGVYVNQGHNPFGDRKTLVNFAGYMANFLGNSLKYAKGENEPIIADARLEEDENYFILQFWDNGELDVKRISQMSGVSVSSLNDPDVMLRVLTSDFSTSGDSGIHGTSQGTGLNMIWEKVQGNMELSYGEHGTQFTVYIPKN